MQGPFVDEECSLLRNDGEVQKRAVPGGGSCTFEEVFQKLCDLSMLEDRSHHGEASTRLVRSFSSARSRVREHGYEQLKNLDKQAAASRAAEKHGRKQHPEC